MKRLALIAIVMLASIASQAAEQMDPEVQLRSAIRREIVDGDLQGAMSIYKQLAAASNRAVAAQALLRLGGCYETLRALEEARGAYTRLLTAFSDRPEASVARGRVAKLPAAPKPQLAAPSSEPFAMRALDLEGTVGATFSPDGKLVAFARPKTQSAIPLWTVSVRDLATGRERVAVEDLDGFRGETAVWTPDGQRFAVVVNTLNPNALRMREARVVVASTSELAESRSVPAFGVDLQLSPDGGLLAYLAPSDDTASGMVMLMNVVSGATRALSVRTDGQASFRWSPDGSRLALHATERDKGVDDIAIVTVTGGDVRRITVPEGGRSRGSLGRWTTGGSLVYWQNDTPATGAKTGFLVPQDQSPAKKFCEESDGNRCLDVLPDGTFEITWKSATKRLFLRDLTTMQERPLTLGSGDESSPYVSPDGRLVVFQSNREGRMALYAVALQDAPVSAPAQLTTLDGAPRSYRVFWTGGGGVIARVSMADSNIYRIPMDASTGRAAGPLERLTQDRFFNDGPAASPDGSRIAYCSGTGTRFSIAVMDASGANERALVDLGGQNRCKLAWRSAEEIIFQDPAGGATRTLLQSLNIRSGERKPLSLGDITSSAPWRYSPASDEVYYLSSVDLLPQQLLRARSLRDGTERTLWSGDASSGFIDSLAVSPQGRIAYVFMKPASRQDPRVGSFSMGAQGSTSNPCSPCELRIASPEGVTEKAVLSPKSPEVESVAWSPDERFVLYLGGGGAPRVLSVSTGEHWALLEPGRVDDWAGFGAWERDGKSLLLGLGGTRNEYRQWTGVTAQTVTEAGSRKH
jgi:Tol biopolymer transport system component